MEMQLQDAERKRARLIASCIRSCMATDADVGRIALSLPGAQKDSPP
jgi:hypothetical protein